MSIEERSGSEEIIEEQAAISDEGELTSENPVLETGEGVQEEPVAQEEVKKPETISYEEYEKLLAEKEELAKQKADKSKFISEMLPQYRQASAEAEAMKEKIRNLESGLPAKDDVWTGEDVHKFQEAEKIKQELTALDLQTVEQYNKAVLDEIYPEYAENVEKIAAEMLRQGANPAQVQILQQNPYRFNSADMQYVKGIVESVKLKDENDRLRNKLGSGVASVKDHVAKVNEVAQMSTVSNSTGTSDSSLNIAEADMDKYISGLSYNELVKLVEEGIQKEK
jgi:hypothetical protein